MPRARRSAGVTIKDERELRCMRQAGLVVARTLALLVQAAVPGRTTRDLDALADAGIRRHGAEPSFLGYGGFPASICASVGPQVVHGIPSLRPLCEGDLLSVDCGAVLNGWHGDAAVSLVVGADLAGLEPLVRVTERALRAALHAVRPGAYLSDLAVAVESTVLPAGFGLVEQFTGHGIGRQMHEPPAVPNLAPYGPGHGLRLQAGMTLAIEPMVTAGAAAVHELDDGWTVVTDDGRSAAHWEHTVAVTPDGPRVLTALEDGGWPGSLASG